MLGVARDHRLRLCGGRHFTEGEIVDVGDLPHLERRGRNRVAGQLEEIKDRLHAGLGKSKPRPLQDLGVFGHHPVIVGQGEFASDEQVEDPSRRPVGVQKPRDEHIGIEDDEHGSALAAASAHGPDLGLDLIDR